MEALLQPRYDFSRFDIPAGHELSGLQLTPIAFTGESIIYRSGDQVLKVNHRIPCSMLEHAVAHEVAFETAEMQLFHSSYKEYSELLQRKERYDDHFSGHVLQETYAFEAFPFPGSVLQAILRAFPETSSDLLRRITEDETYLLKTSIRLQKWSDIFERPDLLSLTLRYAESQPVIDVNTYANVTSRILTTFDDQRIWNITPPTYEEFSSVQGSEWLDALVAAANKQENVGLKIATHECLRAIWDFHQATGEMIDIAGINNIVFYEDEGGGWQWMALDGLYPELSPTHVDLLDVAHAIDRDEEVDPVRMNGFYNRLNFVRGFNGFANAVGFDTTKRFYGPAIHPYSYQKIPATIRSSDMRRPDVHRVVRYRPGSSSVLEQLRQPQR